MFTSNRTFALIYNRCMKLRHKCIHCSFMNYGFNMLPCTATNTFQSRLVCKKFNHRRGKLCIVSEVGTKTT
jgi:hypothetical protein